MKGIRVHFNRFNTFTDAEPCCCEKHFYTKFGASTLFCFICNIFCCRRIFKTASWCKKYGWDKDCRTCQQKGDYSLIDKTSEGEE